MRVARSFAWLGPAMVLVAGIRAQDLPSGEEGVVYYAPRIDLFAAGQGGPQEVELDGVLDDSVWELAIWHGWVHELNAIPRGDAQAPDFEPVSVDDDLSFEWAAVADSDFLYIAWRVRDDVEQASETTQCDVWRDDSVEIYIDARNDGPNCTADPAALCYGNDDIQITVGLENVHLQDEDPDFLVFGGVGLGAVCDFSGPHPELVRGVVREVRDEDEDLYIGWEGEIAVALETLGNNDDGTPEWLIEPTHGRVIGFNIHGQDDDDAGDRDHKLVWSRAEAQESSWRNPGVFAKLMFIDPTMEPPPLYSPVEALTCTRDPGNNRVLVRWQNPPGAPTDLPIQVFIDGALLRELPGSSQTIALSAAQVPVDGKDHVIGIVNASKSPIECTIIGSPFDPCGAIRTWNILGAFGNPGGAGPTPDEITRDYMTDGDIGERDFVWFPGATIETEVNGAAASTSIDGGPAGRNPGGVPTVFSREGASGRILFQSPAGFGGDLSNVMAYAQVYIIAEADTEVFLGISSDDSVQVILNGADVWVNSVPRGGADPCSASFPQDITFEPVLLEEGYNSLVVKVFEGTGDWDFALRFQDELGQPVTEDLSTSLEPEPAPPPLDTFVRGDADGNGAINITDGIFTLNYLFTGGGDPPCADAADADDNGSINITDGIFILNFLFTGGGDPPAPFGACGPDPSEDSLDCATAATNCAG